MRQFKLGERVRITGDSVDDFYFFSFGAQGVVVEECIDNQSALVEFDSGEYSNIGDCSWFVKNCDMELVKEGEGGLK